MSRRCCQHTQASLTSTGSSSVRLSLLCGTLCVPQHTPALTLPSRPTTDSGNVDACVPYPGTEEWTRGLGLAVEDGWRPWNFVDTHGTMVGGYVTTYEKGFAFLIVKGSGHMVPEYQPRAALTMFKKFLAGNGY